jgi:hypothetical protein
MGPLSEVKFAALFVFASVLVIAFQNCSQGGEIAAQNSPKVRKISEVDPVGDNQAAVVSQPTSRQPPAAPEGENQYDDKEYVQEDDDEQSYLCERVIQGATLKPVQKLARSV